MEQVRWLLTDEIWQMLEAIIRSIKSAAGAPPITPDRLFREASLYRARVGCPGRDLPKCFGSWNAVSQRFRRWEKKGIWKALCERLPKDQLGAIKNLFVASTLVRAHAHAAGAAAKRGSSGTGAGSQSWRLQHEDARGGSGREHPFAYRADTGSATCIYGSGGRAGGSARHLSYRGCGDGQGLRQRGDPRAASGVPDSAGDTHQAPPSAAAWLRPGTISATKLCRTPGWAPEAISRGSHAL